MPAESRRDFILLATSLASAAAGLAARGAEAEPSQLLRTPAPPSEITLNTIAESERLLGLSFTDDERAQILKSLGEHHNLVASANKDLPNDLAPATVFSPRLPGRPTPPVTAVGDPAALPNDVPPLPANDGDIAYAPLTTLACWIRDRAITSARLTELYLQRIERFSPRLLCCITVTADLARAQAKVADADIASGRWRGPLHGIPYGLKDIIDTKDIPTTWGAEPWRERVPRTDAWITTRLRAAGAVLVAKTAVGALAYGDIWFGGKCRSPWNRQRGSSGSSAGSASGISAGLFGFAIGTETLGSIVSPADRCGAAGLRPTFGRVPRTGAMSLVWTMDKIGVLCRSISDTALVLAAINGQDDGDPSSVEQPFTFDHAQSARGLLVGYDPMWTRDNPYADVARAAVEAAREEGCEVIEIGMPRMDSRPTIFHLYAEAAAAFDRMTRDNADDQLSWQDDAAWPNVFRRSRFFSAVDLVQCDRIRRQRCNAMHSLFDELDAVLAPPFAGDLLIHTNWTGQPCAVFRAGFNSSNEPQAMTVMSQIFDEGTALRIASALERRLGHWQRRPELD
ncbi:MAG: amidase [Phycisphaerae bacterium]|nr:amidase [Phycisphaerae bacterium]